MDENLKETESPVDNKHVAESEKLKKEAEQTITVIWDMQFLESKIISTAIFNTPFFLTLYKHVKSNMFKDEILGKIYKMLHFKFKEKTFILTKELILTEFKQRISDEKKFNQYAETIEKLYNPEFANEKEKSLVVEKIDLFLKRSLAKEALIECVGLMGKDNYDDMAKKMNIIKKFSSSVRKSADLVDGIPERYMNLTDPKNVNPTFLPTLNGYLSGGYHKGEVTIVMAGSGVGKSTYLFNQAVFDIKNGRKVLYATFELSTQQVKYRMDKSAFNMNKEDLVEGWKTLEERYAELVKQGGGTGKIKIIEAPGLTYTVADLERAVDDLRIHEDFYPDIILVDYLEKMQIIKEGFKEVGEHKRQGLIAEDLRSLGKILNIPIVTATQANRSVYELDDKSKNIVEEMAIGESLDKYKTSDGFFLIKQNANERIDNKARLSIMKNRHGDIKVEINIRTFFDRMKIEEEILS